MASRLRIPALALATLSFGLNIAIVGCAGRPLHIFHSQRQTNVYFLPVWNSHFDTRQLSALIATSTVVAIMNVVLVAALFISAIPAPHALATGSSTLSALMSLIAIIYSTILQHRAPVRDTLLTWTCRWRTIPNAGVEGVPRVFDSICHETRFAYYTTIPSFVLQLLLLALALHAAVYTSSLSRTKGVRLMGEKGLELGQRSGDSKSASVEDWPTPLR